MVDFAEHAKANRAGSLICPDCNNYRDTPAHEYGCSQLTDSFGTKPSFEQALDDTLAEVRAVMVDRHKKYGPGNINRHGEYGVVVRLGDKYERLDHSREIEFADEAVDDTADDIIGYGLIFKMLRAGRWPGQKNSSI